MIKVVIFISQHVLLHILTMDRLYFTTQTPEGKGDRTASHHDSRNQNKKYIYLREDVKRVSFRTP